MPRGRQLALLLVGAVVAIVGLYLLLPAAAGLEDTWRRLGTGDPWWLSAAVGFEVLSFACYVVLLRAVLAEGGGQTAGWRDSYRITMAGIAATRLFPTAGDIVVTAWALHRGGMPARDVTIRTATLQVLLYGWFMAALVLFGVGLRSGVLPGPAPFGLTVVPALFGGLVIAAALLIAFLSGDLDSALGRLSDATRKLTRLLRSLATVPATVSSGVAGAIALVRARRIGVLGAAGWWAFDIAVLWACLEAFGDPPSAAVIVMAYFIGALGRLLPVPGGVGAVDGGMIGALIGFGVSGGLAIVAVLSYRGFAFWLPTIPGVIAYTQLLRDAGFRRSFRPA